MNHRQADLLPGVVPPERSRTRASELARELASARRRVAIEELLDCSLVIVIDLMFLLWAEARLPWLGRDGTLLILLVANSLIVFGYVRARWVPRWRARRIAATWSSAERERFRRAAV